MTASRRRRIYRRLLPTLALIIAVPVLILVLILGGGGASRRAPGRRADAAVKLATPHATTAHTTSVHATTGHAARPHAAGQTAARTFDLARMLGQMIVARFPGTQPSASFLARIRSGQIGGVILFADNLTGGVTQAHALTAELQTAAHQGGNPPLLIMTDQEGGTVRRLAGPPYLPPSAMTSNGAALAQGSAAGRLLRAAGVNLDLAPVTDVVVSERSFLGSRSFGSDPNVVASRACSFAQGLQSQGVGYTLKHFPGLGLASGDTDAGPVDVDASADAVRADYLPYATCARSPFAAVMISSAAYPNLSGPLPAVLSPAIYQRELRLVDPQGGLVTISDDLEAPAFQDQSDVGPRAIEAGLDLALYARTEQAAADAYSALVAAARSGDISPGRIRDAASAIERLKRNLASPAPDGSATPR